MSNENKPIQLMLENLHSNKDAVVILGNDIVKEKFLFTPTENNKDIYCRKQMVKNPEEFWSFYKENIAQPTDYVAGTKEQKEVINFLNTGVVKTVIDMNIDGYVKDNMPNNIDYIEVKGDRRELFCSKCLSIIPYRKDITGSKALTHNDFVNCECSGKIQPTVPFYGAKYSQPLINSINNSIFDTTDSNNPKLKTHALILIGADFADDLLIEIVDSYTAVRGNKNLQFLLMIMTDKNPELITLFGAEFGTTDSIDQSLNRLIKLIE